MKYVLTQERKEIDGVMLRRIKYEDGTLGGWLQREENLDQAGD